ncbi:MAG: hypothetical protein MK212_11020 [Saprospiraceae bacterium]|nr:hypothetical protein [Saprospiraceae bacterium]
MNKRTAKLLKQYAFETEKNERAVKRWWNSLNPAERTVQRKKLQELLNEKEEAEEVVVVDEQTEA